MKIILFVAPFMPRFLVNTQFKHTFILNTTNTVPKTNHVYEKRLGYLNAMLITTANPIAKL